MCGFAGFIDPTAAGNRDRLVALGAKMAAVLRHRGPDDGGVWVDEEAGTVLGHRRLSVIDLSAEGCQPMSSSDGRYVIAYNGEIYNFGELRDELESRGVRFRGHSDTEVLLAAIAEHGIHAAVRRTVGMFAFALWDRKVRRLYLARDRFGEKPLYYGWCGPVFLFGSELKALRQHPRWEGEIDIGALSLYMRHSYVPAPFSIHRGISKLMPGTILEIDPRRPAERPEPVAYWSLRDVVEQGEQRQFEGGEEGAADELERILAEAVRLQMVSDVPLGAFLSGGVDSSAIVALMQAQSTRRVRTFTIGFHELGYNEAQHAKRVAAHLGTDHTELYVSMQEASGVIPLLPAIYDEPFADSSQIPTYLLSRLTRRHVTVSLSGDGGDEIFGGYVRYATAPRVWNGMRMVPGFARRWAGRTLGRARLNRLDEMAARSSTVARLLSGQSRPGEKLAKLAAVLEVGTSESVYRALVSAWPAPELVVRGGREPETCLTRERDRPALDGFVARMMYMDAMTYLPDDVLVKVDRAAMAVSLETRVPFLDHRVIEFAARLPVSMKVRNGEGKRVLRRVLYRHVPRNLIDRPKMGFGLPVDQWLRGGLREWAEDLLDQKRLEEQGLLHPEPVRRHWHDHVTGRRNAHFQLWPVLMLQAWLDELHKDADGSAVACPADQVACI